MPVILYWIIGLVILYLVIKWAIDSSETAENIREIRKILSRQYPDNKGSEEPGTKSSVNTSENSSALDLPFDECPACHSKVLETDKECQSCGLTLRSDE